MGDFKIDSMIVGDKTNPITDYELTSVSPDDATTGSKTEYTNDNFITQWSNYIGTTDIMEVIDAKGRWIVGRGFKADPQTEMLLDTIKGNGKDTFNTIIENMVCLSEIGEDSYSQIIRDDENNLINLKPLNTARIKIMAAEDGLIDGYEYSGILKKSSPKKFKPEEIFHLSRNRRGDEIHGRSMVDILMPYIKAKAQMLLDYPKVMHSFICPQWKFKLKTDDPAEIAAYKKKQDEATGTGANIYEPFDVSESELVSVSPNASLNPITWLQYIDAAFYKAAGVPQFIVGGGTGFTEASEKIAYLAWQQTIEKYQLFLEEQILSQLNLVVEFEFPASLENELLSDAKKDGAENIDKSELNPASDNT